MARDMDDDMTPPPKFGRIDPFCWAPVVPTLVLAGLAMFNGAALPGIGLIFLAIGVVVFDAWVNRPGGFREPREPREPRSRSMWSQYEDDEIVDPVPRALAQRAPPQRAGRQTGGDPRTAPTDPIRAGRRSAPSGARNATAAAGRPTSRSGW
jgi:hypothetical protein